VTTPAAVVACALLAALGLFQLALVLGAPWGRFAWGGQHDGVLPARLRAGSATSIVLYAVFAVLILDRAALVDLVPDSVSRVGTWVLVAYLALGVVMNAVSRSRAERATMTPVSLALAACTLVVALGR
jgi:hydrogenase maturation factor